VIVIQETLLVAVHEQPAVAAATLKLPLPPSWPKGGLLLGVRVKLQGALTVTVKVTL